MKDQKLMEKFGWVSICDNPCYGVWPHTHDVDEKIYSKKLCSNCHIDMRIDAQLCQVEFGKNNQILLNCFECSKCKNADSAIA